MDDFTGQRILIWGAARSGLAAAALLQPVAAEVTLADDAGADTVSARVGDSLPGVEVITGGVLTTPLTHWDALVVSPGVPLWHPAVRQAHDAAMPVLSELEVGARFTQARIAAITGTNGKTTTVCLAAHLLGGEESGVFVAGNVGQALCEVVQRPEVQSADARLVVEVSSFQCEHLDRFHPNVAAVLNIRPDHLDRHGDMEGYVRAKSLLGKNMTERDTVIVNADDPQALCAVETWRGDRLEFSLEGSPCPGVYLDGNAVIFDAGDERETLFTRSEIGQPGRHSVANALAAAAVARRLGAESAVLGERCRSFPGVPHRIEWVTNDRGVDLYNDSKATNLDSLRTALESFGRPIVLIAGGRPKGEDFNTVRDLISARVRAAVVLGEAAEAMETSWSGQASIRRARDLAEAVAQARSVAMSGDVILLSPGCLSFDMFRDFEERGDRFREAVRESIGQGGVPS